MIFTTLIGNDNILNEADSKNKLTMDRTQLLRYVSKLVRSELGLDLEEHTTFRTDKDYGKNDFIDGKCEFVTVAHIKKSAEPYIGNQYDNAKVILDMLNRMANKVNSKIPSDCKITPKYKGDPNNNQWDGWDINLTVPQNKNEFLSESYIGGGNMIFTECTENNIIFNEASNKVAEESYHESTKLVAFSGNTGGSYMHDALYESYIQSKIDSENRLAFALKESKIISESDYSNIIAIREAKLGDKIKTKWQKFVAFIKNMFAKFMESMTNILYDEKGYLEKYKDIILKKKPKEDMEYSYTGDYKEGINRITNVEVPLFEYSKYKTELEAEEDGALANKILPSFRYSDGETLAEQFKGYFLVLDAGTKEGKFSSLNMTELYNFCYNFNKIKNIVNKDLERIDASTRNIERMIKDNLASSNNTTAPTETNVATNNKSSDSDNKPAEVTKVGENSMILEAEDKKEGLKITTTDVSKAVGSTKDRDSDAETKAANNAAEGASGKNEEDITNAADKWIRVCQALVAAKLTACQQISKDYMDIIRAHVRSYVGMSKKSKEGNTSTRKAQEYENKEAKTADEKNKEADAALDKAMNASSGS